MKEYKDKWTLLQDCRRYINAHLEENLDPEMLAEYFGYAYPTFRKFFQKECRYSIHQYVRMRRIQESAKLLRHGADLNRAVRMGGFKTLSGYHKAFLSVYGVSCAQYAATRGRVLMTEPTVAEEPGFYVVGYAFEEEKGLKAEDSGAFWHGRIFPEVSEDEYRKIGGGVESYGLWTTIGDKRYYLLGPQVKAVRYVPAQMEYARISGGLYACFQVPPAARSDNLWDHIRATWYYAARQWLPESNYVEDSSRLRYEFYLQNQNRLYLPVKPRKNGE